MGRSKGLSSFSANFEPQIAAPLDARIKVDTTSDLINPSIWQANDGGTYLYKGMVVSVCNDPTPTKNGLYFLADDINFTNPASWVQLGSQGSGTIQVPSFDTIENYLPNGYFLKGTTGLDGWNGSNWTTMVVEDKAEAKSGKQLRLVGAVGTPCSITSDYTIPGISQVRSVLVHFYAYSNADITATLNVGLRAAGSGIFYNVGTYLKDNTDFYVEIMSIVDVPQGESQFSFFVELTASNYSSTLRLYDISVTPFQTFPKYTNAEPTPIAVGGIPVGTTFNNKSMIEMWDMLLYPELFGTLTPPSATFIASVSGLREVGETIPTINFTATFNRGSINPQYLSASSYRSGLPNTYLYTGTGLSDKPSTALSDNNSISNYVVLLGNQSWTSRVAYDAGVQPKGSKGTDYDVPLPAGQTNLISSTIIGVYPIFGTTVDITTLTKQSLVQHNATYFSFNMVAESGGYKQTAEFSTSHSSITGIQFYNTISGQWEWLGGSKANSLTLFTVNNIQKNINGNLIDYKQYVHNGSTIGSRQLRFYTN